MGKSSIKKSAIDKKVVAKHLDRAIDLAIARVDSWTSQELKNMVIQQKTPVLLNIGDVLFTGYYYINKENNFWSVYTLGKNLVHSFTTKGAAISWCFSMQLNKIKLADEILHDDDNVGRIIVEAEHYANSIKKSKDSLKKEIAKTRMHNILEQANYYKNRLLKNIERAKYLKIPQWDS